MSLANWILPSVSEQQVATWGMEVARGCQADVALRLGPAVRRMSLLEARGYIQARRRRAGRTNGTASAGDRLRPGHGIGGAQPGDG